MTMHTIQKFVQTHFPLWYTNQEFVIAVLLLMGATTFYWFAYRSKPAMIILCTELLYLLPFVRV